MNRRSQETLIGDPALFDFLAGPELEACPHPLQRKVEELIQLVLTDEEREVYYLRFGQNMPLREIAELLGYKWHSTIQNIERRIIRKVGEALDQNLY